MMGQADNAIELALVHYIERSPIAITLSRTSEDFPLIAANPAFFDLTRYAPADVIGRNCRFLQGPHREQEVVRRIGAYLADDVRENFRGLVVNVRADGEPFINLLFLTKLRDSGGACRFVMGSQFDASRSHLRDLRHYDRALAALFDHFRPSLADDAVMANGSFEALAGAAGAIARAKLMLAEL